MTTVKMIDEVFSSIADRSLSESYDNDGIMLCKDENKETKKALVCLDVTYDAALYASGAGFDLIVTHHPLIFNPIKNMTNDTYRLFSLLFEKNISVLSYHTRLDACRGGVNDTLCRLLGLQDVSCAFGGIGRFGRLECPTDAREFGKMIKEKLKIETLRAYFPENMKIRTCAVVSGAGKSLMDEAYLLGADAYVTSELAHNSFLEAKSASKALFDAGHYYTENPVTSMLKATIDEKFPDVFSEIYDIGCPYFEM